MLPTPGLGLGLGLGLAWLMAAFVAAEKPRRLRTSNLRQRSVMAPSHGGGGHARRAGGGAAASAGHGECVGGRRGRVRSYLEQHG